MLADKIKSSVQDIQFRPIEQYQVDEESSMFYTTSSEDEQDVDQEEDGNSMDNKQEDKTNRLGPSLTKQFKEDKKPKKSIFFSGPPKKAENITDIKKVQNPIMEEDDSSNDSSPNYAEANRRYDQLQENKKDK